MFFTSLAVLFQTICILLKMFSYREKKKMQSVNKLSLPKNTKMDVEKIHEISELLYFITHTYTVLKSFQSKQEALPQWTKNFHFVHSITDICIFFTCFFFFLIPFSTFLPLFLFLTLLFFSNCFVLNTIMSVLPLERWIDFSSEGPAISQISDRKSTMSRHK